MTNHEKVRRLTICALLVAVEILLSRFLSVSTPIVKIGFDFAPMALAGMLFGPLSGCLVGALSDFIGANLFPIGPYFPGFTLVAGLSGFVYGALLHDKQGGSPSGKKLWPRIILAVLIVTIPLQLGLDTFWISILINKGFWALLPARVLKCCIMIVVQSATISLLAALPKHLFPKKSLT